MSNVVGLVNIRKKNGELKNCNGVFVVCKNYKKHTIVDSEGEVVIILQSLFFKV